MNNRIIKFRAWDKVAKKMYQEAYLSPDLGIEVTVRTLESAIHKGYGADRIKKDFGYDEAVLMQFTGLKDAKGKEIYEGDIVSDSRKGEVYWDEDSLQWWVKIEGTLPNVKLCTQDRNLFSIIGNIYESPELLK